MKKLLATAFALITLTGCSNTIELGFAGDPEYRMIHSGSSKIKIMEKDPFTLEMAAFTDARTPDQFAKMVKDGVIYEYDADKILQDISIYVPSKIARHIRFGDEKERLFMVDISLTTLRPWIETGSIFRGGFGGYVVDLAATVRIRNEFSRVIMEHPIVIRSTKYRRAVDGYHPTAAQDRQEIRALISESMKEMAIRIGWLAHQGFVFDEAEGGVESEKEMQGAMMDTIITEAEFMRLESADNSNDLGDLPTSEFEMKPAPGLVGEEIIFMDDDK